jgi:hypothetical protein
MMLLSPPVSKPEQVKRVWFRIRAAVLLPVFFLLPQKRRILGANSDENFTPHR